MPDRSFFEKQPAGVGRAHRGDGAPLVADYFDRVHTRDQLTIEAGIGDLLLLRSAGSAFEGYIKDPYTTLPETKDRIFQTALLATWRYKSRSLDFNAQWERIRATILD